jgi:hypothetical protein
VAVQVWRCLHHDAEVAGVAVRASVGHGQQALQGAARSTATCALCICSTTTLPTHGAILSHHLLHQLQHSDMQCFPLCVLTDIPH